MYDVILYRRYVFGGFTERPWQSTGDKWLKDAEGTFVFRLEKSGVWAPLICRAKEGCDKVC